MQTMFLSDFDLDFEIDYGDLKGFTLLQPCAKSLLLICAKRFYKALELTSKFSFALHFAVLCKTLCS